MGLWKGANTKVCEGINSSQFQLDNEPLKRDQLYKCVLKCPETQYTVAARQLEPAGVVVGGVNS